jgi:hypothetical protein
MGFNLNGNTLLSTTITPEGSSFKHQKIVASGGDTITYNGQWKIHRFNSSGTFVVTSFIGASLSIDYLIVGGGGGGGMDMGGGGGGGGVITGSTTLSAGSYPIVVGGGGAGAPAKGVNGQPASQQFTIRAVAGSNTTFNGLTAYGGGYGASSYYAYTPDYGVPGNGGCGGAPSAFADGVAKSGGTGTAGQGFAGGSTTGNQYYGAGGGGAGAVGTSGNSRANGGAGKYSNILGRPYYWGGGGGGSGYSAVGGYGGIGGGGGGAIGDTNPSGNQSIMWGIPGQGGSINTDAGSAGGNGGTNTGGGGGGGSYLGAGGGNGGSGIVIIRYKYK